MKALLLLALLALGCSEGHGPLRNSAPAGHGLPPTELVRFAAIGDYGSNDAHEGDVAALVKDWHPDFIITLGDNNYPGGDRATIDANIGKYYSDYIGGYMGRFGMGSPINLFFPCIGNHEFYNKEGLQPYLDYFSDLPGNKRYFDFEMGLVHFYVVDSDDHEPDGATAQSTQALWLKSTLALPTTACYKVVYFHHPPYTSGDFAVPRMRWPFASWGADVVLAGHDHIYERLSVDNIPYFVNGVGGAGLFSVSHIDPHSQFRYVDPDTNLTPNFGAQLITATRDSIIYDFYDVDGGKIDTLTVQPRSPCP